MNDTILGGMAEDDFVELVSEVFKLRRDGHILALSTSLLAHSSLVEACFLTGEPVSSDVRGRAMQSVLRWAVDKVRPGGEHNWYTADWRPFNILYHFYLRGMRVSELAERMAIAEQTLYQWRVGAITAVARVLREAILTPQDEEQRKNYAIADRYARHSLEEKIVLRLTAVFRHPVPTTLLHQLADVADVGGCLRQLVNAHLLVSNDEGTEMMAHPEVAAYLLTMLTPDERQTWHRAAGDYYRKRYYYLESARHYRLARQYEEAARVLIDHYGEIIDNLQMEELQEMLGQFELFEVEAEMWPQLKIVAGEVAEMMGEVEMALAEYQQALGAKAVPTKALAYYRRARVLQQRDIQESLAHHDYAVQLLTAVVPPMPLLAQIYINRAWIYFQQLQDLTRAEADLQQAQQVIAAHDDEAWSDWHSAWGELYYHKQEMAQAIQHHWQARLRANEIQDLGRMTKTAHNLGLAYVESGDYEQGLIYLQESQTLAVKSGHRHLEGLCYKHQGACYYWLNQYDEAIRCYQWAHDIFTETGNRNSLAYICYDLAEVYAQLSDGVKMKQFFDQGMGLAHALKATHVLRLFESLAGEYAQWLALPTLNERQQKVVALVQEKGRITNQEYRQAMGVSQKQAVRDLNELLESGILKRVGRGRSTRYELVG